MSKSRALDSSRTPTSVPSAADIESAAIASLQSSRKGLLPRSSLPRRKASRKPVPLITPNPIAFPVDEPPHPDEKRPISSQRRLATSNPSAVSSQQRITPPPVSPSPPHLIPRSPLVSTGQPVLRPATSPATPKLSPSLARNSSVPASLSHTTQSRPSLSSPSPPTPIVPSIPLRHATQHSLAQPSNTPTSPLTSHMSYSVPATSVDRHTPAKKGPEFSPIVASFATASDPNLPSRSATSTPVIPGEPTQYSLPLKLLLSKPANPSNFQSGSESEGGSLAPFSRHQRSTSATESIQFAIRRDSDISAIEHAAIISLQPRPLTSPGPGVRDQSNHERYHYRRTTEATNGAHDAQRKATTIRIQESSDEAGWWPDWKPGAEDKQKATKNKGKDNAADARPRNVLRRRPSNSSKPSEPRSPTPSSGPRLSRSLSTSSLLKRAGFLTARTSTIRSVSPLPKQSSSPNSLVLDASASPSPVIFTEATDRDRFLRRSHVDHTAAQPQDDHKIDTNSQAAIRDLATNSIPTSILTPSQVSKQPPLSPLQVAPVSNYSHQPMSQRLSTISSRSGSSAASKVPLSRDKALSPAGAVADAYKREQFAREAAKSTPTRPPRPPSPNLPPTVGDSDNAHLKPDSDAAPDHPPGSKRSSKSGLSYAEIKADDCDVTEKRGRPSGDKQGSIEGPQHLFPSEITGDGILVTAEVSSRSFLVQSPQPSDTRTFSPRSSLSSPLMSNNDMRYRNRLKKARHTSDQSEMTHKPYYTVVGARSDQVFSVGGPRDSFGAGWGVQTTITAGTGVTDGDKEKVSLGRSLSRKLSGKFKRERSGGGSDEKLETTRGRPSWQENRAPSTRPQPNSPEVTSERKESDDRCLPYLYSLKKHAQSEMDISAKEKAGGMFPKFWRIFGRSKSKERNGEDTQVDDPPPLPILAKHRILPSQDIYSPTYSQHKLGQDIPSPQTRKSPYSSKSTPSTPPPSARPSTATSDVPSPRFWNRHNSAPSSTSSLGDIPPMPSPLPNLTRYASTDDSEPQKPEGPGITRRTRPIRAETEQVYKPATTQRSDSPPIPSFSTVDAINSFPRRRSSDRSKNSPTTPQTPSPISPPPRPARSSQRPKTQSRPSSFGDEALYPPVMKQSTRSTPKMTFREIDSGKREILTEQEKSDRWNALLEKSDAAGGTLHFEGNDDKLPSDDLRFSRTLSELAQDDD